MWREGKIRSWNDQKGFGFIEPSDGSKDVFLHISALQGHNQRPNSGQMVNYTVTTDSQGRLKAGKARYLGGGLSRSKVAQGTTGALLIVAFFFVFVAVLYGMNKIPSILLWAYPVISLVTFVVYAFDKDAAQKGRWRTKENTLHCLSLVGGWPGALIAQQSLRHKSKKRTFRSVFWVTVFLNVAGLFWTITPAGSEFIDTWLDDNSLGQDAIIEWAEPREQ